MNHSILVYESIGMVPSALDGTKLFYGLRGPTESGKLPIVLLDGLGCDGFAWTYLQPRLSQERCVLHPHYRGHGRSGAPRDLSRIDMPTLAKDVLETLKAARIDKAVFVGHSMGTQVALEVYRHAPEKVAGLGLVCGSSGQVTQTFHGSNLLQLVLPYAIESVQRYHAIVRAAWSRLPARWIYRLAGRLKEIDVLALREQDFVQYVRHFAMLDPELWLRMLRLAGEHDAHDVLRAIKCPTCVVAAEKDTFTPPSRAHDMADHIMGATFYMIPGGTHAAPVEQPEILSEALEAFFAHVDEINEKPRKVVTVSRETQAISKDMLN